MDGHAAHHPRCFTACTRRRVPTAETCFFHASLGILALMLAELLLLLVALGPCTFFCNLFYLLDMVVVLGSLALELRLRGDHNLESASQVIIFTRVWRLVRIGHGLHTTGAHSSEREVHELERVVERLQAQRQWDRGAEAVISL
jgi:hypothetical protein